MFMGGGGGSTGRSDKLNDDMMFSCCCGRVGPTWYPVCGCYQGSGKCGWGCLEEAIGGQSLFYNVGVVRTPPQFLLFPGLMPLSEPLQQPHIYVSKCEHLDRWAFPRWWPRLAFGFNIWSSSRSIRVSGRSTGCKEIASSFSRESLLNTSTKLG
jgi:hypothetical protein